MAAQRKSIDCRDYPSEKNCSLKISGTEQEVLDAAVQHAVSAHGTRRDAGIARAD
jgi:predicted small metal-binding protein